MEWDSCTDTTVGGSLFFDHSNSVCKERVLYYWDEKRGDRLRLEIILTKANAEYNWSLMRKLVKQFLLKLYSKIVARVLSSISVYRHLSCLKLFRSSKLLREWIFLTTTIAFFPVYRRHIGGNNPFHWGFEWAAMLSLEIDIIVENIHTV